MQAVDSDAYLKALLSAPRPGADKFLAFYDHRVGRIGTDPRLLLLPLDDHLCHRGDGLFESICCRERKIFALDAHLARMRDGARALNITPPCAWEELRRRILDVARASGRDHGDLRVFLSRGPGGFGISPMECPQAGLYIVALAAKPPREDVYRQGLTAFSSAIPPKQEYLARIKSTNYLPNVFMAAEARQKGMDVAVSFDENGFMGEAAIANLGIVDAEGRLRSPEIRRILPGTTLLAALDLAGERMPVLQGPIHKEDIATAREMLLFTSATLCVAVTRFDGRPVGQGACRGKPGPTALWLKDALLARMLAQGTPY
ncbi:aminotransferase class IV [Desulfovibrio sp. SGI.169]|uniref:aminotransferase class IV n=1 Tax=Desulfovibrio sp. SGI.169 TaxID=3420561 RepID=UPI003CFE884D